MVDYWDPVNGEEIDDVDHLTEVYEETDYSTEYGRRDGHKRVIDPGLFRPESTWAIDSPLDSPVVQKTSYQGSEYFFVDHNLTGEELSLDACHYAAD